MSILIKNATIVQKGGPHHLKRKDILINNGKIQKIGKSIKAEARKVIKGKDLHVSIGWMDLGTHSGEPGFEHRETIESLGNAAAAGGYTALAVFPNTKPVIDNSSAMQVFTRSNNKLVQFYPIGALSVGNQSKDLAELIDMHKSGAIAFSDGLKSVNNNGLMLRGLQYVKSFDGLIIHYPNDHQISQDGEMHEGEVSTSLGLTGIPSMAELSHVERDVKLLEYTESKILVHLISAKESVSTIKLHKRKNNRLYTSVSYLNLVATDEALKEFDSNYKLIPPLRTSSDQNSLIKAVKDGTIDIICSNHVPVEEELKKDAFPYTKPGAIGLQSCFCVAWNVLNSQIEISKLVDLLAENPRDILKIDKPKIEEGEKAELCIFDLKASWAYTGKENKSKSQNSPFIGTTFNHRVVGVVNGTNSHFN